MSTAQQSLKVLTKIWGNREGYVFLPWINGDATQETRKSKYHEGRAFDWPREKEAILSHLEKHVNDDVYFCPNIFLMKRRATNFAAEEKALWADLDEINPEEIQDDLRPTIAWESSPGRYQAIWLLTEEAILASEAGGLGQRLTYYLGADLGGWDSTQLLRPPGWRNHKPEYREQYGEPAQGRLLWGTGPRYEPAEIDEVLPHIEIAKPDEIGEVLEREIEQINRSKVIARIRNRLPRDVKRLLDAKDTNGRDRSSTLFYIKRCLAEVDCTLTEIVAIVRPTIWNKFDGRNDELKRLQIEATKAIEKTRQKAGEEDSEESDFEVADRGQPQRWGDLSASMSKPRWLIEDIWTKGACGIIGGPPKSMKSYISLDLIVSIISGEPFLGQYRVIDPGPVLYIQEEDPVPEVDTRLERITNTKAPDYHPHSQLYKDKDGKLQWGPSKLDLYAKVRDGIVLTEPEDQEWLDEIMGERQYKALILDPLGMFLGDVDDNRFGEMNTRLLKPLKQLAEKHKTAIIIVHHTSKSSDVMKGRAGNALLGSRALHAWTEDLLYVQRASDISNKLVVLRESKRAAGLKLRLNPSFAKGGWDANIYGDDDEKEVEEEVSPNGRKNATYTALRELGDGAFSAGEIAEVAGIKLNTVRVQLTSLKEAGFVENLSRGRWSFVNGGSKRE